MAKTKELSESTSFTVSVQTLGGIAFGIATVVDMKDQLIRQTIMTTQEDVKELKEDMKRIEDKIDKLR